MNGAIIHAGASIIPWARQQVSAHRSVSKSKSCNLIRVVTTSVSPARSPAAAAATWVPVSLQNIADGFQTIIDLSPANGLPLDATLLVNRQLVLPRTGDCRQPVATAIRDGSGVAGVDAPEEFGVQGLFNLLQSLVCVPDAHAAGPGLDQWGGQRRGGGAVIAMLFQLCE